MTIEDILARETGTDADDWTVVDGPDSGVGVDYWFESSDGRQAYANLDQDHLTIEVDGEVVYSGEYGGTDD